MSRLKLYISILLIGILLCLSGLFLQSSSATVNTARWIQHTPASLIGQRIAPYTPMILLSPMMPAAPLPTPLSAPVAVPMSPLPTPYQTEIWTHVDWCEEQGNWYVEGPTYYGGLGWLQATWNMFKTPSDPPYMSEATPVEQIEAGVAFAVRYYGYADGNPEPSLSSCGSGY
jgi:hypothetical protein